MTTVLSREYLAGAGADVNDYLAYRMNFGATASMSIASEDWAFTTGITAVGVFSKVSHLNAGGFNRALFQGQSGANIFLQIATISSDVGGDRDQTLSFFIQDGSAVTLCDIATSAQVTNSAPHNFLFSYNPATAAAHLYLDDVSDIDTGDAAHVLTTGTMPSGAGKKTFGARNVSDRYWGQTGGTCGYFGIANTFIDFSVTVNRRKFFDSAGLAVKPDEIGWSQFGGVTPYAWHPTGDLRSNRGSKSDFTDGSTTAANLISVL